jgi:hypothetical protein
MLFSFKDNKMSILRLITLCSVFVGVAFSNVTNTQAAAVTEFLPKNQSYNSNVPTPTSVIGFGLGDRHVRYDQLLSYLSAVEKSSNRVLITETGRTHQFRSQVLLTISSPQNLAKLDTVLKNRNNIDKKNSDEPLVIWLGYSVHGDELSGANASMAVAYHLAASNDANVKAMLENSIIVIEPSINPDGMDRFVNWVSDHTGSTPNADPNHIEHHQGWRRGRTNHFGFDLNRDWLLLSQVETRNRMAYFHRYQPHVVGDFHEMGSDSSYFFQPGVPSRTNPLTPKNNITLTHLLAGYHAEALDSKNRLYYSEENFDDFYYGKGSTYPDINGSVGVLFEQATSRGMQVDSVNGLVTLSLGIENQVLTSLSTIKGAWENKDKFKKHRKTFYKSAEKQAKKEKFSGYLITESQDTYRLEELLNKLKLHQIKAYQLKEDFRLDGNVYSKSNSYYIPLSQPKYKVIKALFGTPTNFEDNTFYDVSGWTLPLAMNIEFHEVGRTWGLKLRKTEWNRKPFQHLKTSNNAYAYAFEWNHFLAPKLLNKLLDLNLVPKVATKPFTSTVAGIKQSFNAGTVLVLANNQKEKGWQNTLLEAAKQNGIQLASISTGLTSKGVDLGSSSLRVINPINVLLVGGTGVSESETGEVKFYLDDTLNIPVSVIEKERLQHVDLNDYSHILMVDGNYNGLNAKTVLNLELWINAGGVLFAQKRAAKWLSEKDILKTEFVNKEQIETLFDNSTLSYQDKSDLGARMRIAGAIFNTQLDLSHPLAFGFTKDQLPVFRNNNLMMNPSDYPFVNVGKYTKDSLLSGYTDNNLVNRLSDTASLVAHNVGKGRVIATTDNLVFRGYWHGTSKLLSNTLFFGKAFSAKASQ